MRGRHRSQWIGSILLCLQSCLGITWGQCSPLLHQYIVGKVGGYTILPTCTTYRRPQAKPVTWWCIDLLWRRQGLRIRCVWHRGRTRSRRWLAPHIWDRRKFGPYGMWLTLLLLACVDIEPNLGPPPSTWSEVYAALKKVVTETCTACIEPPGNIIRWASYNIGGPSVHWDRCMTICTHAD